MLYTEDQQREIAERLGVTASFDPGEEAHRRIRFLADYLQAASCHSLVWKLVPASAHF
jgi:NAD+ synthase